MATRHTAIFRGWRRLALLALLVITTFGISGQPGVSVAAEVIVPATLTGEIFRGFNFVRIAPLTEASCNENGGTFTFSTSGTAEGPYPGVFEESGTITVRPGVAQSLPSPAVGIAYFSQVDVFEATFTVDSPLGRITGTKRATSGGFLCANFTEPGADGRTEFGVVRQFSTFDAVYQATIQSATGTYQDTGSSIVHLDYARSYRSTLPIGSNPNRESFTESFRSNQVQPTPVGPATLTLTPNAAVNPVGTSHTVTATALNALGQPVQGVTVRFAVSGSTTASGSCTTDANGQCAFTYQGPQLPGADLISACADTNTNNACDPGEPVAEATKAWVLPLSTPGQVTGGGQVGATNGERITFGFNAQSTDKGLKGVCTVIDQATDTQIKCLDVTALVQTPATAQGGAGATFFGNATINGVATTYRIDVNDAAEPGTGRDTFAIQTTGGYTAGGVLTQGNIQIHRAK